MTDDTPMTGDAILGMTDFDESRERLAGDLAALAGEDVLEPCRIPSCDEDAAAGLYCIGHAAERPEVEELAALLARRPAELLLELERTSRVGVDEPALLADARKARMAEEFARLTAPMTLEQVAARLASLRAAESRAERTAAASSCPVCDHAQAVRELEARVEELERERLDACDALGLDHSDASELAARIGIAKMDPALELVARVRELEDKAAAVSWSDPGCESWEARVRVLEARLSHRRDGARRRRHRSCTRRRRQRAAL